VSTILLHCTSDTTLPLATNQRQNDVTEAKTESILLYYRMWTHSIQIDYYLKERGYF